MSVHLDIGVLGPLQIHRDGSPVRLGPQQAALLSVLVMEPSRAVPAARLVELLWGVEAATSAQATLRSHVANLRRALEPERRRTGSVLVTVGTGAGAGYELRVPPERIDAYRFEHGCAAGQRLLRAGEPAKGAAMIREHLALWRGPALADVADRPFAAPRIARLNALREAAHVTYAEALFALGRYAEAAGELAGAVTDDPYDEGRRRLLALALYHQQRVNEAAEVCREGVALLRARGLDAPELQVLHRAILRRDLPGAVVPEPSPPPRADPVAVPCLLPGALPG